jgi:hypothetical protein
MKHDQSALEASAPAAFALEAGPLVVPACLAHWLQHPSPSDIEAIRLCSSFANRTEHAPLSGSSACADLRARLPRAC